MIKNAQFVTATMNKDKQKHKFSIVNMSSILNAYSLGWQWKRFAQYANNKFSLDSLEKKMSVLFK